MIRPLPYVRYTLRQLRKSPGFTTVAVLTLALGIGATAAMYTVLYATILAPMPYPHPEQLVMVWSKINSNRNEVSAADYLDWKRQNTVFKDIEAWASEQSFNLSTAENPEEVPGRLATPGWFRMQGFQFFLGRDFLPEEGALGQDHVAVISYRLWERLGSDRNIVGHPIRLNGEPYTVVGVLKSGVADRLPAQVTAPLTFKPEQINYNFHWLDVMGRLKPNISLTEAQAAMDVVAKQISDVHPQTTKGWGVRVEPLRNDFIPRETLLMLKLLMGAVGCVLLIACANLANLLLARAMTRQKEVAIRASLGAHRRELFAQFMTESLFLALLGGAAGIGFAQLLIGAFNAIIPVNELPSEADISISMPILLFALTATTIAAALFGSAPAWQASGIDPNRALKEGGSAGTSSSRQRLRRVLVVGEFALALVLLSSAGLAIHSLRNLSGVDLGIRTDHILNFIVPIPDSKFSSGDQLVVFYRELIQRLKTLPGVINAQAATGIPLTGRGFGKAFSVVGRPVPDAAQRPGAFFQMVTPEHFQTFGIHIIQGRSFNDQDVAGGTPVAMVNETFVRRFLQGADPLSQRISVDQPIPGVARNAPPVERQIVGVFHNVKLGDLRSDDTPEIDIPFYETPWPDAAVAVRTAGDPAAMTRSVAAVVASMDRDLPITNVQTMEQVLDEVRASDRFQTILYATFAAFALLLAAVGIYGVMAFAVAQRTHEIGIRMALGAARQSVLGLVLKEGMTLAVVGSAFGFAGSLLVGRAMKSMLYGIGAIDLSAFFAVALVLLAAALAACFIPARRAAKVDPMVALRYQ
jgi:putative ABC transport system permease protein